MNELMISGYVDGSYVDEVDAYKVYGVRMGDQFLETLLQPSPMKEVMKSDSRLENGKRVNISSSKQDERSITLGFVITNGNGKDMLTNLRNFYSLLYNVRLRIRVPKIEEDVYYHLLYTGKSISYGMSIDRTTSKLSVKFDEPNPSHRTSSM